MDWLLLELLQQDGRMTVSELANQLGCSRSNISEYIEKLQNAGVLSGFSAQINEEKLGFGISAFVRLQAVSSHHRKIINTITEIPEVAECHVLTGAELLIIRVVARDMPHLRDLVDGFTKLGLLNLNSSVESRKSAQALGAPGKLINALFTNQVITAFLSFLCTPIAYTSFSRSTEESRLKLILFFLLLKVSFK